jgi:uncharacterized protein YjbJ (UPF0337 family)
MLVVIRMGGLSKKSEAYGAVTGIASLSGSRDKAEGTLHEVKGKVKEVAGELSDNPKLEAEGTGEKIAGKVQKKIGQIKKVWEK